MLAYKSDIFHYPLLTSELKEKISGICSNTDFVIKYQVFPEDLDALVSVRTDEDLHHMLEEYDRHENLPPSPSSHSRFRLFLFPSSLSSASTPASTPAASASTSPTYLDAINCKGGFSIAIPNKPPIFSIYSASACSSPPSAVDNAFGPFGSATKSGPSGMQRVRSTPNLSSASLSQMANSTSSAAGSPKGGFYTPHHHQQHQYKGMTGYGAGGGGMSRMGGSHRHETCGCGCGCVLIGHPSQRRYYYPPAGGPPCGCRSGGHVEEPHTPRSSYSSSFAATPPIVPRRSIWE